MNYHFDKYQKHYSYLFLAAYLFLLSLTVFHYHHIDITSNNFKIETDTGLNSGGPFDKLVDINHECMIQQFTRTVLNYSFNANLAVQKYIEPQVFAPKEIKTFPNHNHFNCNPLRAPPALI